LEPSAGATPNADEHDALIRSEFAALSRPLSRCRRPRTTSGIGRTGSFGRGYGNRRLVSCRGRVAWPWRIAVRADSARLIGARPDRGGDHQEVSEGLNIVGAGSVGARRTRSWSFQRRAPQNVFPWLWQARESGAEVVSVVIDPKKAWSRRSSATSAPAPGWCVTRVDWTGRRTDLTSHRQRLPCPGAFLLVDAAQYSGVLAQDMRTLPVDGWPPPRRKGC